MEVVYVSLEPNEKSFNEDFSKMPWAAHPYTQERQQLAQHYEVSGIPALVIVERDNGRVLTKDGVNEVQNKQPNQCLNDWSL